MADDVGVAEAAIALEYLEFLRGQIARSHEWAFRALRHGLAAGRLRESTQAAADFVGTAAYGPLAFSRFAETAERRLFPFDEPISGSAGHALMMIGVTRRRGTRPDSASTSDAGARSSSATDSAGSGRPTRS